MVYLSLKKIGMKANSFKYHLLFWILIYALWVFAFHAYSVSITKTLTVEFCYLLFITADYYTISCYIVPKFLQKKRYGLFIIVSLFITAISALLRSLLAVQMNYYFFKPGAVLNFTDLYINSFLYILFWVLLITVGRMLIDSMQQQHKLEFFETEKTKNELNYLKAQINPHALFNSLNTIYGHIDRKNQMARNILLQFSELLRYQLYDCSADKIILEKEVTYLKNYIAFQQLRKDNNLEVNLVLNVSSNHLKIAPLMLVVLLENAFKFVSTSSDTKNSILIKIELIGNNLHTTIRNTIDTALNLRSDSESKGIGLINLKRRLELLYPGQYKFTAGQTGNEYITNLTIDLS